MDQTLSVCCRVFVAECCCPSIYGRVLWPHYSFTTQSGVAKYRYGVSCGRVFRPSVVAECVVVAEYCCRVLLPECCRRVLWPCRHLEILQSIVVEFFVAGCCRRVLLLSLLSWPSVVAQGCCPSVVAECSCRDVLPSNVAECFVAECNVLSERNTCCATRLAARSKQEKFRMPRCCPETGEAPPAATLVSGHPSCDSHNTADLHFHSLFTVREIFGFAVVCKCAGEVANTHTPYPFIVVFFLVWVGAANSRVEQVCELRVMVFSEPIPRSLIPYSFFCSSFRSPSACRPPCSP